MARPEESAGGSQRAGAPARPVSVIVGLLPRGGGQVPARAVAASAEAVLSFLGVLPPPGNTLASGGGWVGRAWASVVMRTGAKAAVPLAWPAALARALASARTSAAEAMLAKSGTGPTNAYLLRSSLWRGLVSRFRAVGELEERVWRVALDGVDGAVSGRAAPAGGRHAAGFAEASAALLEEADRCFFAAAAVAVAADLAAPGCGEWEEQGHSGPMAWPWALRSW